MLVVLDSSVKPGLNWLLVWQLRLDLTDDSTTLILHAYQCSLVGVWAGESDFASNNLINTGNIDNYFTESCSEGSNNQFVFILFIQSWYWNQPMIGWTNSRKIDLVWNGLKWRFPLSWSCYLTVYPRYVYGGCVGSYLHKHFGGCWRMLGAGVAMKSWPPNNKWIFN